MTHNQPNTTINDATPGPSQIGLTLATVVIALLTAAVLLAALLSPIGGIALGGLALVLFLTNPAVWTAALNIDDYDKPG